jgi:hypothetical protein
MARKGVAVGARNGLPAGKELYRGRDSGGLPARTCSGGLMRPACRQGVVDGAPARSPCRQGRKRMGGLARLAGKADRQARGFGRLAGKASGRLERFGSLAGKPDRWVRGLEWLAGKASERPSDLAALPASRIDGREGSEACRQGLRAARGGCRPNTSVTLVPKTLETPRSPVHKTCETSLPATRTLVTELSDVSSVRLLVAIQRRFCRP